MKCKKCNFKNRATANYCLKCGSKFSEEEKENAQNRTLVGILETIEKWYDRFTLKFITDNIVFKVLSILVVLGIGIYYLVTMGNSVRILDSDKYILQYNKKDSEYYLIAESKNEKDEVPLDIFIPNRCKNINVIHYDAEGKELEKKKYTAKQEIILKTNTNDYYILTANYLNEKKETFKLVIYKKEDVKLTTKEDK